MKKIQNWIKDNKIEFFIILLILLTAAFFRFYRLSEYMTFLGDEGRDALVIKKILTQFDFPLLGPATSVGNMYLGPLYYYMMTIPMAIFWLNPVAAAGMVALIGTLTVGIIYYLSRKWFGVTSAVIASTLYSLSSVNIYYSHSSWNPNPAPFFTLLTILGLYKFNQTKNGWWLILVGTAFAFLIQMHYLALILLPIVLMLLTFEVFLKLKKNIKFENFFKGSLAGLIIFLFLMSPVVIFDIKHNFMNYRAITTFFLGDRATTVNLNIFNTLGRIPTIYQTNLVGSYITDKNPILIWLTSIIILIPIIFFAINFKKTKKLHWPLFALSTWLIVGIMGLALYKQSIFDHYLGFLNPAPFILLGSLAYIIQTSKFSFKKFLQYGLICLILILAIVNLMRSPLLKVPNKQLQRTQDVSRFVISEANNKPYNFALIAKSNYDDAYEYYLELFDYPPMQVPFDITGQLFVVCEDQDCQPINHPKYEIAAFGWAKIETVKEFSGVKVFKLIHNNPKT